jgi:mRNA interferase MazF
VDLVSQPPILRFDVYLVRLDPSVGAEMRKTRPCVVISPDIMHRFVRTVIIAPLTSRQRTGYPTRVRSRFNGRLGEVALDHMRAVDQMRLVKRLGTLDAADARAVKAALVEMFE